MVHTCPQIVTAGSYVLGVLGDQESHDFHQHAQSCRYCHGEIQDLAVVADFLAALRSAVPAPRRPD